MNIIIKPQTESQNTTKIHFTTCTVAMFMLDHMANLTSDLDH